MEAVAAALGSPRHARTRAGTAPARQDGTFSRENFRYDREGGVCFCLAGKMLSTRGSVLNDDRMYWSFIHLRLRGLLPEAAVLP